MAGPGIETQTVELLQLFDALQAVLAKRTFAVEGVQDDALQQIAQSYIVIVGKGPQHFQEPLFHADTRLYPFHDLFCHWYQNTTVPNIAGV
jgi:hypothetical protein